MGYYVKYTIKVPKDILEEVLDKLNSESDYEFYIHDDAIKNEEAYSGFNPYAVFPILSSHFPNVEIKVLFDGESSDDLRAYMYKNGEQTKEVDLISDIYKNWESYI